MAKEIKDLVVGLDIGTLRRDYPAMAGIVQQQHVAGRGPGHHRRDRRPDRPGGRLVVAQDGQVGDAGVGQRLRDIVGVVKRPLQRRDVVIGVDADHQRMHLGRRRRGREGAERGNEREGRAALHTLVSSGRIE